MFRKNKQEVRNTDIVFDYSKLKGRVKEKGLKQEDVARIAKMAPTTYSQKINSKSVFTQKQILALLGPLSIPPAEIGEYFFTPKV